MCCYRVFNRLTKEMDRCENDDIEIKDASGRNMSIDLCREHYEFVKDSTTGPFTKSKKLHPADYDWIAMAQKAYLHKPGKLDTSYCEPTPETISWLPKFTWTGEKIHDMVGNPVRGWYREEKLPPIEGAW